MWQGSLNLSQIFHIGGDIHEGHWQLCIVCDGLQ